MIIDVHTHCFPDDFAQKAMAKLTENEAVEHFVNGTIADLKRSMRRAGIDCSVLQLIATKPQQTPIINRWALEVQDSQIKAFGTLHPDYADWKQEITWLKQAGIKGVKFHPDYQDYYVDELKVFPIYEEIFAAGLMILFHAGIDLTLYPPCHCPPQRLEKVVTAFPGGKIIAAHMGGYNCWEDVRRYLLGRDLYFDTSYSYTDLGKAAMLELITAQGVDKVLFGTDSPWASQSSEVENIKGLGLLPEDSDKIMGENARVLLGLE